MNARVYSLLCALLAGCVLPDYDVVGSKDRARPDAGGDSGPTGATSSDLAELFPDAEPDCESCAKDNCATERAACGADCSDFSWPVSPIWQVSDQADPYVKCLATKCNDQCNVLWGCNKEYLVPEAQGSGVTIRVTDAVAMGEIPGIRVKACQDLDPSCQIDVGQSSSNVTNASGRAVLALPRSFEGYFLLEQAEPSDAASRFMPMTVTWSQPLYKVETVLTVSMFKAAAVTALAGGAIPVKTDKGHLVFKAMNCLPQRYVDNRELNASAEGVVVNYAPMNEGTPVVYTRNGLKISPDAKDTSYDGAGFGGAFNLSPGAISVLGVHDDVEVSNAVYTARPDTIAIVFLLPRAR
jgi:hypothetical protein